MAKAKATETKVWRVLSNGAYIDIDAGYVEIVDGNLILTDSKGGHMLRAFAMAAWTTVEAVLPQKH